MTALSITKRTFNHPNCFITYVHCNLSGAGCVPPAASFLRKNANTLRVICCELASKLFALRKNFPT